MKIRTKKKIILSIEILAFLTSIIVLVMVFFLYMNSRQSSSTDNENNNITSNITDTDNTIINNKTNDNKVSETTSPENAGQPSTLKEATKKPATEINIMMIGDMLIHQGVLESGFYENGSVNYTHLFREISTDITSANISILNQETILGGKNLGYSYFPRFNSPQEIGDAEIECGFNVILHATNHTMDMGLPGVQNCMSFWQTKHPNIPILGINATKEDSENIYVYEEDGFKIAILNYTYGTNGLSIPSSMPYLVNILDEEKIRRDVTKAKELADMVIVCPHWGTEYSTTVSSSQKKWTELFLSLDVDVVIGTHPHVLQPVELLKSASGHEMLVYYSLGNYISNQDQKDTMIGGLAKLTLAKDGKDCYIKNYELSPIITHKAYGPGLTCSYKLSEYTEDLALENGIRGNEGCGDFSLQYCKDFCKNLLGKNYNNSTCQIKVELR